MSNRVMPGQLPRYIDHTLLKADAGARDIERLCREALEHSFYSVCVNSSWTQLCAQLLRGSQTGVSVVCGFPLGAAADTVKAFEAAQAVEQGATEIDMVISVGSLLDGDERAVYNDIAGIVKAVEGRALVKAIIETGYLNDEQKRSACRIAVEAGAHFVKTSTGFGPGGATAEDIALMRQSVPASVGVKASGGVRDTEAALRMIGAGATRIGTSSGIAIIGGAAGGSSY